jgi:hypothetical protein
VRLPVPTAPSVLINALDHVVAADAPLPAFNEVSLTLYPRGSGHITAHRDPAAFTGVIAVTTLSGSATPFEVSLAIVAAAAIVSVSSAARLRAHDRPIE